MTKTFLLLLPILACGEKDGGGDSTPTDDTAADSAEPIEFGAWADMDRDTRLAYMQQVVLPEMGALWATGPDGDEALTCQSCHSADMVALDYAMPNSPERLEWANFPTHGSSPEADFMFDEFTPKMVDLLDEVPYDLNTGEGFSCSGCHIIE